MPPLDIALGELKSDLPLALFPVRLETRFMNEKGFLFVRVFPDTVHVDSFEKELTGGEVEHGKAFWRQTWLSGNNQARQRAAWANLAQVFGSERAAWIATSLSPSNPNDRPQGDPLKPEQPLPVEPRFPPTVPGHDRAWTRAPYVQILPDCWIALGYQKSGERLFAIQGRPIRSPLHVGLTPAKGGQTSASIKDDPEIAWLVDFEAAEQAGMALKIPLDRLANRTVLDRLVVLGVKTGIPGEKTASALQQLLDAHHYTDGLGFIVQGTPTNNTPDASSGYRSDDPAFETSFRIERQRSSSLPKGSNGKVMADALGLNEEMFSHIRETDAPDQTDAELMNRVLWPATWGYFLEQLMAGPESASLAAIRHARSHFERYVRARGPLPPLRVSRQPYGVLPVMSLARWTSRQGEALDEPLVAFLRKLREEWSRGVGQVSTVLDPTKDRIKSLLTILSTSPLSSEFFVRRAQRAGLVSAPPPGPDAHQSGSLLAKQLAEKLGLSWIPSQVRMLFEHQVRPLATTLVPQQAQAANTSRAAIKALLERDFMTLFSPDPRTGSSITPTLIEILFRHACLQTYVATAVQLLTRRGRISPEELIWEREQMQEDKAPQSLIKRPLLSGSGPSVGKVLDDFKTTVLQKEFKLNAGDFPQGVQESELSDFVAFLAAVIQLKEKPESTLDRLLRESLDLCSHRLDAWITSFATKRLAWIRSDEGGEQPKGIYLGGYGWVEDLQSGPPRTPITGHPSGLSPLYEFAGNHGFIHAPSLSHATTAALLRSGYVSRRDSGEGNAVAVNLSSERVRLALSLLEGVRQGQSLGALLGYRFERGLHENHPGLILDSYIPAFRQIAPIEIKASTPDAELNTRPITNVVDGLALLKRYKTQQGDQRIPWETSKLPAVDSKEFRACVAELDRLEDTVDAISDLVLAESVHHVAQGNPVRAGATLDAIAAGEAPPPDLDVIHTPRSGIGVIHRLGVLFSGQPTNVPLWPTTERAKAEPWLNAWAAQLLGPSAIGAVCRVKYIERSEKNSQRELARRYIALRDLKLAPIDLVYAPEGEQEAQRSDLELRVCLHAQWLAEDKQLEPKLPTVPDTADLQLTFVRDAADPDWPPAVLSFAEVIETARAIRRLVTDARPLRAKDLNRPEDTVPQGQEQLVFKQLGERAEIAVTDFQKACGKLEAALPAEQGKALDRKSVHENLLHLAEFGLPGSVPRYELKERYEPTVTNRDADKIPPLRVQVDGVLGEAKRRLERISRLDSTSKDYHQARLGEVFGPDFRVLPRFELPGSKALGDSLAASESLQGGNPLESLTWVQRMAKVREAVGRFDLVILYAEALGSTSFRFTVGQLPHHPNERWAALTGALSGSRLSLVLHIPSKVDLGLPLAGLLVDEWVEAVPSKEETTGLAFHFDSPQSRPPQAILLAVPSDEKPLWDVETLEATVTETIDLLKLRAVDLQHLSKVNELGGLASFLPALFVAQNDSTLTITGDLPTTKGAGS